MERKKDFFPPPVADLVFKLSISVTAAKPALLPRAQRALLLSSPDNFPKTTKTSQYCRAGKVHQLKKASCSVPIQVPVEILSSWPPNLQRSPGTLSSTGK